MRSTFWLTSHQPPTVPTSRLLYPLTFLSNKIRTLLGGAVVQPSPGAHFRCHPICRCQLHFFFWRSCDRSLSCCLFRNQRDKFLFRGTKTVSWDPNFLVELNLYSLHSISFEAVVGRRGRAAQPGCPLPPPSDLALPTHTFRHFVFVSTACDCRRSASTVW